MVLGWSFEYGQRWITFIHAKLGLQPKTKKKQEHIQLTMPYFKRGGVGMLLDCGWAYRDMNKMNNILQVTFSNELYYIKIYCTFAVWFKFHWSLSLLVQFSISQHWFRLWQAPSHYLTPCPIPSLTHKYVSRSQWVNYHDAQNTCRCYQIYTNHIILYTWQFPSVSPPIDIHNIRMS